MAINTINVTIQMRKGLERDFDADQMTAGEWAVSTDTKYVRMCFAPGLCLRMATYEGFELDMEEVQNILKECQDIQAAVDAMAKLAEQHKNAAAASAKLSESWAKGETGIRAGENTNNSKYFSNLAKTLTEEAEKLLDQAQKVITAATQGALIPGGTVAFGDLPINPAVGYMYNISNDFTTDNRFVEGAGIFYRAGANVYWTADGKWDVMIGTQVTGIKGAKESLYRVGDVNLTPENLGAVNEDRGNISDTIVTFQQATALANVQNNDSMSTALGKLSKLYAHLEGGQLQNLFSGSLAGGRAMATDANGKAIASDITANELNMLDGVTSNIQQQIATLNGNLDVERAVFIEGGVWYKTNKFVLISLNKTITKNTAGWNVLSSDIPTAKDQCFAPYLSADLGVQGILMVINNSLQIDIPSAAVGKTFTVRGQIMYRLS